MGFILTALLNSDWTHFRGLVAMCGSWLPSVGLGGDAGSGYRVMTGEWDRELRSRFTKTVFVGLKPLLTPAERSGLERQGRRPALS